MEPPNPPQAELVLPCVDFDASLAFFTSQAGFRLETIFPADAPHTAILSGHGSRLRLLRAEAGGPSRPALRLVDPEVSSARQLLAPGGVRVDVVPAAPTLDVPALADELVHTRAEDSAWGSGRAGMEYRDLVPGRLGGHLVASHIRIRAGGAVPDYVHHHDVRVQMIFARRGWVELVYEDQGPPFLLEAGDCVLQPPGIRHRVLRCSDGLEVVELGSPAEHPTHVDHALELPTELERPERSFGGQRFVRHRAVDASWEAWRAPRAEARDLGIGAASGGLAQARVVRARAADLELRESLPDTSLVWFVLAGGARVAHGERELDLGVDDALVLPHGSQHRFVGSSADFEWLEVELPLD